MNTSSPTTPRRRALDPTGVLLPATRECPPEDAGSGSPTHLRRTTVGTRPCQASFHLLQRLYSCRRPVPACLVLRIFFSSQRPESSERVRIMVHEMQHAGLLQHHPVAARTGVDEPRIGIRSEVHTGQVFAGKRALATFEIA